MFFYFISNIHVFTFATQHNHTKYPVHCVHQQTSNFKFSFSCNEKWIKLIPVVSMSCTKRLGLDQPTTRHWQRTVYRVLQLLRPPNAYNQIGWLCPVLLLPTIAWCALDQTKPNQTKLPRHIETPNYSSIALHCINQTTGEKSWKLKRTLDESIPGLLGSDSWFWAWFCWLWQRANWKPDQQY